MYVDSSLVRTIELKVRLNKLEAERLKEFVQAHGGQKLALCRDFILQGIEQSEAQHDTENPKLMKATG